MVLMNADEASEAGEMPHEELLAAMGALNEKLVKAGVMLYGDGLHPSGNCKARAMSFEGTAGLPL